MTPEENAEYLRRMRVKAGAEFMEQSVGLKMLFREMVKAAAHSAELHKRVFVNTPPRKY